VTERKRKETPSVDGFLSQAGVAYDQENRNSVPVFVIILEYIEVSIGRCFEHRRRVVVVPKGAPVDEF
jgi:hypothetical protein